MQSPSCTWIDWFWGPALGVTLISWAFIENFGPGLGLLCILGGLCFILLVPLIQFALLRTKLFRGQLAAAGVVGILITIIMVFLGARSGAFNFW